MWRCCYTFLMYAIQPLVLIFMLLRSIKSPNYRKRLNERYGLYFSLAKPQPNGLLLHAASVGEVIAATPLIKRIQQEYPHLPITVTTVTPTGSDRVVAAFGQSVKHFYLPYDLPFAIRLFIRFVQPKLCIVIETEIWPNLIHQLHNKKIPFIIANARLSERSTKRYSWVKKQMQNLLQEITLIASQDEISGERYLKLGYPHESLVLTGNIKYDLVITDELSKRINQLRTEWKQQRPLWIAASTHEGEEDIILTAHQILLQQFPNLLLILVPRHPERFAAVKESIKKRNFAFVCRSTSIPVTASTQVVLGDTMGELMLMYGISDVAFVGGSLVKHGGHNPLEPLAFKIPVISGKHTFNFPEVFRKLLEVRGVLEIDSTPQALASAVEMCLNSKELSNNYGNAGYAVLNQNRGALQRLLNLLHPYLTK